MQSRLRLTAFGLGLAFALTAGVAPARAGFNASVTTTVTPQTGGLYLYKYVVADSVTSTDTIGQFDLALTVNPFSGINTPLGAPISSITMATGFVNEYTMGDPSISFVSTDPSTDIVPGSSATFTFTSTFAPVMVPYQFDTFDGTGNIVMGMTFAPATVPEPSSLALSGLGVLGLFGWLARARSRRRDRAA